MKRTIILGAPLLMLGALAWLGNSNNDRAEGYVLNPAHWTSATATYYVNANFTDASAGTAAQQTAALQRAASEWKSAGQVPFQFLYGGTTSASTVNASDGINNVFYSASDGGGALATCFYSYIGSGLIGFDIQFYHTFGAQTFVWSLAPTSQQFDIESVATHEFGHALGMGHSAVSGATMFPSVSAGSIAPRTLAADDVAGVQAIYGVQATGTPTVNALAPWYAWIAGGTRITLTGTELSGSDPQVVKFDGVDATDITVIDNSTIECILPAGTAPGFCDVFVSHGQGSVTRTNGFFYQSLRVSQPLSISTIGEIECLFPTDAALNFSAAPAYGFQSGISLTQFGDHSDTRVVPLDYDGLFQAFYNGFLNSVFTDFSGTLNGSGQSYIHVDLPFIASLQGQYIVVAGVTLDAQAPSGIRNISNALTCVIGP